MHAGITPKYRGVHGAYWAQVARDAQHAGVTIHLVDPGIDTGGILYQARITPEASDNYCTYPLLQIAAGRPLLLQAVSDALNHQTQVLGSTLPSRLYFHPTLWQYVWFRLTRGAR
jgi:methionyl-tRNA formyltransferase